MKKILLIKGGELFWGEIERRLTHVNAHVSSFVLGSAPNNPDVLKPDLIIINESRSVDVLKAFDAIPKMYIRVGRHPGTKINEIRGTSTVVAGWPMEELSFLEITSRMLHVSERRVFRTLIRLHPEKEDVYYLGMSEDFSSTGISFKMSKTISNGEHVRIQFHMPGINKTVEFEAIIARHFTDHSDGSDYYGARFGNLNNETREILERFVLNG